MFDWMNTTRGGDRTYAGFERMETSFADVNTGIAAGTKVATRQGWREVEALAPGDDVLTFDNGVQKITEIRRFTVWSTTHDVNPERWPLHVPVGALGNANHMTLMPDQPVMIESDAAEDYYGDAFALILAGALDGFRGIERITPPCRTDVVCLHFAADQMVYTNGGALFLCPMVVDILSGVEQAPSEYTLLNDDQADIVLSLMELNEVGLGGALPKCTSETRAA